MGYELMQNGLAVRLSGSYDSAVFELLCTNVQGVRRESGERPLEN